MKMRKAKRLAAFVLAGIMMMSLVGCGKGGSKDSGKKKEATDVKNVTFAISDFALEGVEGDVNRVTLKGDKLYFITYEWIEGDSASTKAEDSSEKDAADEGTTGEDTDKEDVSEEDTSEEDADKEDVSEEDTSEEDADKEDTSEEDTSGEDTSEEDADGEDTSAEEGVESEEMEETIEGTSITRMYMANVDGTGVKEIPLPEMAEEDWINTPMVDDAGEIVILINSYDEKTEKQTYTLAKLDADGKELQREDVTKVLNLGAEEYMNKIFLDQQGRVVVVTEQAVKVLSEDYKSIKEIKNDKYIEAAALTKDGQIICGFSDEEGTKAQVLDVDGEKWGDSYKLSIQYFSSSNAMMDGIADYDFYYSDDTGVYGYSLADKKETKLLDFVASDISSQNTYDIVPVNKDEMIGQVWDSQGKTSVVKYVKVDPSQVVDKTTITFGGVYIDDNIKTAAIEFNKTNKEYRIEFIDYSDNEDPATKMNADIVAGNIPDIIYADTGDLERYAAKGILEDLIPYYDKDEELNTSDMIPAVFEAMKIDGKLYYVSPSFGTSTIWGSSKVLGTEKGWTFDEFKALMEEQGDSVQAFAYSTKEGLLYDLLGTGLSDYVDWQTGECSLDSPEVKAILEYCNTGVDEEDMDYGNQPSLPTMVQEGKVLLNDGWISLEELQMHKKMFGGDITFIGYPNKDKEGSYFNMTTPIGISAKSEYKDVAWEFVRTFMTKKYQAVNERWNMNTPTRQDCLDMMIKAYTTTESYTDEFGQEIAPVDSGYSYDDWEVEIGPSTQEEAELFTDLINSTHKVGGYDYKIMEIIQEEAKAYFAGDKSVDEVVDIIQNRVSTYVNENR